MKTWRGLVWLGAMLLAATGSWAQAPAWQQALAASNHGANDGTTTVRATAVDAAGNVLVTGSLKGNVTFGNTHLTVGAPGMFVAKWNTALGDWAWAVSATGTGTLTNATITSTAIAVSGTNVYVAGSFDSRYGATVAGTTLVGAGGNDIFLAKFVDNGTSVGNGWAIREGGTGADYLSDLAATGSTVYATGSVSSSPGLTVAGTPLAVAGGLDMVLARYIDAGTTVAGGGALCGGGTGADSGVALALSGSTVYVAGTYTSATAASIAGTALNGAGLQDVFVAKYTDTGAGLSNGWAISGGGNNQDYVTDMAVQGTAVYATGYYTSPSAVFAGQSLTRTGSYENMFVARYEDAGTRALNGWARRDGASATRAYSVAVDGSAVYIGGVTDSNTTISGTTIPGNISSKVFVARYTDTGTTLSNGWATADTDGNHYNAEPKVLVNGPTLSVGFTSGTTTVLRAGPYVGPASAATLGWLHATTGTWQGLGFPLQVYRNVSVTTSASDAAGNIFVAGYFAGQASFGTTKLTSLGDPTSSNSYDTFIAKWSPATGTWLWALRDGGTLRDEISGLTVQGTAVYATGLYYGNSSMAGTTLPNGDGTGQTSNMFLAKYIDNGTSVSNGWGVGGGGTSFDGGAGVAVAGTDVYVAGTTIGGTIAGTVLSATMEPSLFIAKYVDNGATVSNGWAMRDGLAGRTAGRSIAVSNGTAYVCGNFRSTTSLGGTSMTPDAVGYGDGFLAKYQLTATTATPVWGVQCSGPIGDDLRAILVNGNNVYVTGQQSESPSAGVSAVKLVLDKYTDNGTTASRNWSVRDGQLGVSIAGTGLALRGNAVYVAGAFICNTVSEATIAGTTLPWQGNYDLFVAKYLDNGTAAVPAWAAGAGSTNYDYAAGVSLNGSSVYLAGYGTKPAQFGTLTVSNTTGSGGYDALIGMLSDAPAPVLSSLSPASGPVGTSITLTGTGLTGTTTITFAGGTVTTGFTINATGTQITGVLVPTGATTGAVTVTTPTGTSNALTFTVLPVLAVTQGATSYPSSGAAYDFGSLAAGATSAAVAFTLTNNGATALTLTNVSTTGDYALSGAVPTTVPAGGTATVRVTFTPTAGGTRAGSLLLTSSLGTYTVNLTGTGVVGVPTLTSLSPSSGPIGTQVTLSGTNLGGVSSLSFNGTTVVRADFVSINTSTIVVQVPAGATTGQVTATTSAGTSNGRTFTVTAAQLAVLQAGTSYPSGGAAYDFGGRVQNTTSPAVAFTLSNAGNATLTIAGISTTGPYALSGTVPTTVAAGSTATVRVTFTPPAPGAQPGTLVITSSLGTYTVNLSGTGLPPRPVLSSLSPTSGLVGSSVVITGTNLDGATSLSFNGTTVSSTDFVVNAAGTQISGLVVPVGATTGPVVVTTPSGSSNSLTFTVVPLRLLSATPAPASVGAAPTVAPVLTFNGPLTTAQANGIRLFSAQAGGSRALTATGGGSSTVTLAPATPLRRGEVVRVSIPASKQVVEFSTASASGSGRLGAPVPYTTGISPSDVALGDVTGDNLPDLVTADLGSDQVGIRPGRADGSFGARSSVSLGPAPATLYLADFNNDGRLDILVTHAVLSGGISVALATAGGGFAPRTSYSTSAPAQSGTVGDFNGDGYLDIAAVNTGDNNSSGSSVNVYLNDGTGAFLSRQTYSTGSRPSGVAAGDVNNDGILDLVVTAANSYAVAVLRGTGTGSFAAPTSYPMLGGGFLLALGDLNHDGWPDIVAGTNQGASVSVFLNTGTGGFGPRTDYFVPGATQDVDLADMNGDGHLDVVVPAYTSVGQVAVLLGTGTGTLGAAATYSMGAGTRYTSATAVADLNGDGRPDVAASNETGGAAVLLGLGNTIVTSISPGSQVPGGTITLNGSGLTGATTITFSGTNGPVTVTSGFTVNAAGTQITGVVVPTGAVSGLLTVTTPVDTSTGVYFFVEGLAVLSVSPAPNAGSLPRSSALQMTFNQPVTSAAALNVTSALRGGRRTRGTAPDVAVLSGNTLTYTPAVPYLPGEALTASVGRATTGLDSSALARPRTVRYTAAVGGTGRGVFSNGSSVGLNTGTDELVTGDVDGDGDVDVISQGSTSVQLGRNGGIGGGATGVFTTTQITSNTYGINDIDLADFDGDGDLDLAVLGGSGSQIELWFNNGTGTFTYVRSAYVGSDTSTFGLADMDGDGDVDILATTYGSFGALYVLLNGGDATGANAGTFSNNLTVDYSFNLRNPQAADVDGDGDLDLLAVDALSDNVAVFRSTLSDVGSTGLGFVAAPVVGVNTDVRTLAVADVDGDGDVDLVANSRGTNQLRVYANDGTGAFALGQTLTVSTGPDRMVLADVDADGDLDLWVNHNTNSLNQVTVLLNGGDASGSNTGSFVPGAASAVFTGLPAYALAVADVDGDLDLDILVAGSVSGQGYRLNVRLNGAAAPAITSLAPASGVVGTVVTITGTDLSGATSVSFNGTTQPTITSNTGTSLTVTVPTGATTGLVSVTTPGGISNGLMFTVLRDLVISTGTPAAPVAIAPDDYRNITITGTGAASLTVLELYGTLSVENGGYLALQAPNGLGNEGGQLVVNAGATLAVRETVGLNYTSQNYVFSTDANYIYDGTAAQQTGLRLPATVRSLTVANPSGVTLSNTLRIAQTLTLSTAGNLSLNGQSLTLLSDASGTALVVNSGTGVVTGGTATVQRYLTTTNTGLGYRHYSSPVRGNTLADLQTTTFTPVFNTAYNTSAQPNMVTPFPTVLGYDQARVAGPASTYSGFDKGWYSPATGVNTPAAFEVGKGYSVNLLGTEKVDFTGTLNTGPYTMSLARTTGPTAAVGGWALVGNPYPAPIDWSRIAASDRAGLDASMYVFESTSAYGGGFRAYVNGVGSGSPLLGTAQGFFVQVSSGQTAGTLTFRDAHRLTSYATQVPVRRSAADTRPQLQLTLAGAGLTDEAYLYAETGATPAADAAFDAQKLPNPHGLNLATLTATGQALAIDGRAELTTATTIPLHVSVPAAGSYTLTAAALTNLAPGTRLELVDAQANTRTGLTAGARYAFTMTATAAPGRFWLNLVPAAPLATAAEALAAQVQLFPNPAHGTATLLLPAALAASPAELLNSLGQVVRRLTPGAAATTLDLHDLAAGVYTLRLRTAGGAVVRRLVVE